ncbi:hypothetical protein DKX38_004227 [Salix brachista]|uniref:ATP synthase F1 complex delta/epsilon subunit N-terminal domain-containing protein n=1 Tax=Salix brachista TaxID=2182728 RepID=A0A5N5NC11_9ROSI|nr:hypothetical protein DKX38_004227 [Salix brachista]
MLRQTSRLLARSIATTQQPIRLMGARPMSTNMPATPVEDSTFAASWKKVAPLIDPPKTPSAFMKPRPSTPSTIPSKITVNFVLPYASQLTSKEVTCVIIKSNDFLEADNGLHAIRVIAAVCLCSHLALGSSFDLDTLLMVSKLGCVFLHPALSDCFYFETANDVGLVWGGIHESGNSVANRSGVRLLLKLTKLKEVLPFSTTFTPILIPAIHDEVDMVIIPATTGQMGVLPGHVPTIAELKPGVLSVHEGNDVKKYFLSSGFVFVHANSVADIVVVEAVPVDRIDQNLVQKGLADFTQKLSSATTELEKAEAQIGIDVHSALNSALAG